MKRLACNPAGSSGTLVRFCLGVLPVLLGIWLVQAAAVWRIDLGNDRVMDLWVTSGFRMARWPLAAMLIIPAFLCLQRTGRLRPPQPASPLRPLWFLPPVCLLPAFADLLPAVIVSNGVFFGSVLLLSRALTLLIPRFENHPRSGALLSRRAVPLLLFAVFFLFYYQAGMRLSRFAGEHLGDEGHYIIQQQSLFEDRDLDIANQLDPVLLQQMGHDYFHIASTSREPHLYSWHPFGLPLLAAPLWPRGAAGRHVVMSVISAWGVVGIFTLCREAKVRSVSALFTAVLFGFSAYWALFALRFLPEILGASLLVWSFVWVRRQADTPWRSLLPAVALHGFLPFAHDRFIPAALMSFGFYGLMGLTGGTPETWPRRLLRLTVFTLLSLATFTLFAWVQFRRFEGGTAYPVGDTLFSYMRGTWEVFADHRGAAPLLPLLYWMLPAALLWPAETWKGTRPADRLFALSLPVTYLANLLTTCSNVVSVGGAAVQGRYLLVAVPLLLPGAAVLFERKGHRPRFVFLSLALVSVFPLFILLHWAPHIGRLFVQPFDTLSQHPVLHQLFAPYLHLKFETFSPAVQQAGLWFPAGLILGMLLFLLGKPRLAAPLLLLSLAGAAGVHHAKHQDQPHSRMTHPFERLNPGRVKVRRIPSDPPVSLVDFFDESSRRLSLRGGMVYTNRPLPRHVQPVFAERWIDPNDWDSRGYRWLTLAHPFRPLHSAHKVHVSGSASPGASVFFAVREGAHTLLEEKIEVRNGAWSHEGRVETTGRRGHVNIVIRGEADGEWEIHISRLNWIPYHPRMLKTANLYLAKP